MAESSSPHVNMRIEAVRVAEFRALRDVCVTLDPGVTVLVGENNTGKSAFLEALSTALGQRTPTPDDLHIDAQGKEFYIDLLLVPTYGKSFDDQFAPLFGDAIFMVDNDRDYVAIRTTGSLGEDRSTINRNRSFIKGWTGSNTPNSSKEVETSGWPVTERHLSLISFALLEANRDLVDEMRKRSSRWGRLLVQHDLDSKTIEDIESQLTNMGEQILSESQVLRRLSARLDRVKKALPTVNQVELEPLPGRIDDLTRATDILINTSGGPRLPLRMQGLGSRSLAEIMVYTAFAAELSGIEEPYSPHRLSCFEEPEAHLHPQAQRSVMNIVNEMEGQSIVTTHSPQIAGEVDFKHIRLFRYSNSGIEIRSTDSLPEEDLIKAQRMINRSQAQDFLFARLVIFGDGLTEYSSIQIFAHAYWGVNPAGKGVTFVDPSGLEGAGQLIKIIKDFGVPWLALVDGDGGGRNALKAISRKLDSELTIDSKEVVVLPHDMDYEKYLTSEERLIEPIEQGIIDFYGEDILSYFWNKHSHLNKTDLLEKFLSCNKGTYGAPIAEAIVKTTDKQGNPYIPSLIKELLERADRILKTGRSS